LLFLLILLAAGHARAGEPSGQSVAPIGVGSLPGRLFADGTVCVVAAKDPTRCEKILLKLPDEIVKKNVSMNTSTSEAWRTAKNFFNVPGLGEESGGYTASFYGLFDVDQDGEPEVFLDYWPSEDSDCPEKYKELGMPPEWPCQASTLLVYKKVGTTYRTYIKLYAESLGPGSGAWFLDEAPVRKALFSTRGGSTGNLLFYLDFQKRSLTPINDGVLLQEDPIFKDVNKDGVAEIFLVGRGRDRSGNGAGLLHWQEDTYQIWWPDWPSLPYVMYAQLVDVDNDQQQDIIAVLDPEGASQLRELGVWKLTNGGWTLADKVKLPAVKPTAMDSRLEDPTIVSILPTAHGAEIDLTYGTMAMYQKKYIERHIKDLANAVLWHGIKGDDPGAEIGLTYGTLARYAPELTNQLPVFFPQSETLRCRYLNGKLTCEGGGERVKETTNAQ
jgi:hypothetical protein